MSNEKIVLKVNDIVQNPFLACDYLFIEEKRKELEAASMSEMKTILDFVQKDRESITSTLASKAYKVYVNAQKGVKDYEEQIQALETLATTAIDTVAGAPITTVFVLFAKAVINYFKNNKVDVFVDEFYDGLSKLHINKRLEDLL